MLILYRCKEDKITQNAPMNQTNFSTKNSRKLRESHFSHIWYLFLVVEICISDFTVLDSGLFVILFHVAVINYYADIS